MEYFTESNHLLSDPPALRQQFNADGYLFFRDTLPQPEVLSLRRQILEFCQEKGWLRKGRLKGTVKRNDLQRYGLHRDYLKGRFRKGRFRKGRLKGTVKEKV